MVERRALEITFLGRAAEYRAAVIATHHPPRGGCLSTRPQNTIEGSLMEDLSGVLALLRLAYEIAVDNADDGSPQPDVGRKSLTRGDKS